jgi:hypothetical protein
MVAPAGTIPADLATQLASVTTIRLSDNGERLLLQRNHQPTPWARAQKGSAAAAQPPGSAGSLAWEHALIGLDGLAVAASHLPLPLLPPRLPAWLQPPCPPAWPAAELTGTIPPELALMPNLTLLDLAYNQLTGECPRPTGPHAPPARDHIAPVPCCRCCRLHSAAPEPADGADASPCHDRARDSWAHCLWSPPLLLAMSRAHALLPCRCPLLSRSPAAPLLARSPAAPPSGTQYR